MGITNSNKELSTSHIDCGDTFKVKLSLTAEPDTLPEDVRFCQWYFGEDAVRRLDLPVLRTVIRRSCKVQEATFARQPLRQYAPNSAAAADYESLCCELLADWGECRG